MMGIPIKSNLSTLAIVYMSEKRFCQCDNISTVQVAVTKLYRCVSVRCKLRLSSKMGCSSTNEYWGLML